MQLVKNSVKGDKELSDLHKGKKSTFRGWLKDFKKLEESRIHLFHDLGGRDEAVDDELQAELIEDLTTMNCQQKSVSKSILVR